MKELWKAFIARCVYWLTPDLHPPLVVQLPEPPLRPGKCECSHPRCTHIGDKGKCTMEFMPNDKFPHGSCCGCEIFVPVKDDGGGNGSDENEPKTPTPEELERLYSK